MPGLRQRFDGVKWYPVRPLKAIQGELDAKASSPPPATKSPEEEGGGVGGASSGTTRERAACTRLRRGKAVETASVNGGVHYDPV